MKISEETQKRHKGIKEVFGFGSKQAKETPEVEAEHLSLWPILGAILAIALILGLGFFAKIKIEERESSLLAQEREREIAEELERKNAVQYARLGFLDSFPPLVSIADASGELYALNADESYTPMRARAGTWINYLPIKQDTVLTYRFSAEGFKTLEKKISYPDWYPNQDPEISLQKTYRKIVLEPNKGVLLKYCEELSNIEHYKTSCELSVFDEIAGRQVYHNLVQNLPENIDKAAKTSMKTQEMQAFPRVLTGSIHIMSDSSDAKVFFMGEPLMLTRENGSMVQARLQASERFTFSSYGQNRLISIHEPLSIRVESSDGAVFVTEIQAHDWHCESMSMEEFLTIEAPPFVLDGSEPKLLQYACRYSIDIEVNFSKMKAMPANVKK